MGSRETPALQVKRERDVVIVMLLIAIASTLSVADDAAFLIVEIMSMIKQ